MLCTEDHVRCQKIRRVIQGRITTVVKRKIVLIFLFIF